MPFNENLRRRRGIHVDKDKQQIASKQKGQQEETQQHQVDDYTRKSEIKITDQEIQAANYILKNISLAEKDRKDLDKKLWKHKAEPI